jgi:hypothetical protein
MSGYGRSSGGEWRIKRRTSEKPLVCCLVIVWSLRTIELLVACEHRTRCTFGGEREFNRARLLASGSRREKNTKYTLVTALR